MLWTWISKLNVIYEGTKIKLGKLKIYIYYINDICMYILYITNSIRKFSNINYFFRREQTMPISEIEKNLDDEERREKVNVEAKKIKNSIDVWSVRRSVGRFELILGHKYIFREDLALEWQHYSVLRTFAWQTAYLTNQEGNRNEKLRYLTRYKCNFNVKFAKYNHHNRNTMTMTTTTFNVTTKNLLWVFSFKQNTQHHTYICYIIIYMYFFFAYSFLAIVVVLHSLCCSGLLLVCICLKHKYYVVSIVASWIFSG